MAVTCTESLRICHAVIVICGPVSAHAGRGGSRVSRLLPSTTADLGRAWPGSRRYASANASPMTCGISLRADANSVLPRESGCWSRVETRALFLLTVIVVSHPSGAVSGPTERCRRPAFSSLPLFSAPRTGPQLVRTSVNYAGIRTTHGPRGAPRRTPSPLAEHDTNGTEHVSCPGYRAYPILIAGLYRKRALALHRRGHVKLYRFFLRKHGGQLSVRRRSFE